MSFFMSVASSDAVADVAAAAEKLRADDRLLTSAGAVLGETEVLLDAITELRAEVIRRLSVIRELDATKELCGRSTRNWLHEDQRLAGPDAGRLARLATHLP